MECRRWLFASDNSNTSRQVGVREEMSTTPNLKSNRPMVLPPSGLVKNVSKLIKRANVKWRDEARENFLRNKMIINFDVFCSFVKYRIFDNINSRMIFTINFEWRRRRKLKF